MKLTALKNKKILYLLVLLILFIGSFLFYFLSVQVRSNDRILKTSNGTALYSNENPTFKVDFGNKENPDSQYVRFETIASSTNPFEGLNKKNIFTILKEIFTSKKKTGIEMSIQAANFSETTKTSSSNKDVELKKVADILGTSNIKTQTTLVESGYNSTASQNEQNISKPTVINSAVSEGIDFEYQIINGKGIKENIVIQSLDSFSTECNSDFSNCKLPLNEYVFNLKVDEGVQLKSGWYTVDGKSQYIYYFVDRNGNYIAHFLPSYAEDSVGNKTFNVSMVITDKGDNSYEVKVTLDSDWMLSSDRVYPIRIDPSIVHDTSSDFSSGTFMSAKYLVGSELQISDPGVLGSWSFDETTNGTCSGGGDICDNSGNNYNATIAGTVTSTAGIDNYARDFNGATGTHASLGDLSAFEVQTFTIEGWIRKEGTCGAFNYCTIFSKGGSGFKGYTFGLTGSSPVLDIRLDDQGSDGLQVIHGTTVLSNNTWYYVAVVVDGVNKSMKLYLNGNLEASGQYSDTISYSTEVVKIGNGNNNDDLPFYGSLDDIRFSTRAKSQSEIQNSYNKYAFGAYRSSVININGGLQNITLSYTTSAVKTADGETPYSSTGLVAQWNFNETSGTTATSGGTCGTSCNGTLTNMTTTGQDVAASSGWTANNRRWGAGALMFDGTDDYVTCTEANCGGTSKLDLGTSDFTFEAWIKTSSSTTPQTILRKGSGTGTYYLFRLESGKLLAGYKDAAGAVPGITGNTLLNDGNWHYVVASVSRSSGIVIYVDGRIEGSTTTAGTGNMDNTDAFSIGSNLAAEYFKGVIDTVRIYNRTFTSAEVLSNYNSGVVEFQVRGGNTTNADDGSWSNWTTVANESTINSFDNTNLYSTYTPGLTAYWSMDDSSSVANKATTLATGGTVTYSNGYVIHTFTSSGTLVVNGSGTIDVLVVGGGGGGGGSAGAGGGGGAGGVVYSTGVAVTAQSYAVTVGAGGSGSSSTGGSGTVGGNSSLGSLVTANGGGGGGGYNGSSTTAPTSGGSGGGGGSSATGTFTGASGTSGQGNSGGAGVSTSTTGSQAGGGGGGASAAGTAGTASVSGSGGNGVSNSITGTAVVYGGGGAGSKRTTGSAGTAGTGGGGTSGVGTAGGAGTNGLGGGGGGGGNGNSGGKGGSGIVIVRYLATQQGSVNTSYNGTLTGTTSATGLSSNARSFNGSSNYISVGTLGDFGSQIGTSTTELWMKSTDTSTNKSIIKIIDSSGYASDEVYGIEPNRYLSSTDCTLSVGAGYTLFYIRDNTGKEFARYINKGIYDGNWHHIVWVVTSASSNSMTVYVDGVAQSLLGSCSASPSSFNNWTKNLYIGASDNRGTAEGFYSGLLDEVRIFNSTLSAGDVQADYLQGLETLSYIQKSPSSISMDNGGSNRIGNTLNNGLVAYWNLNESSGSSLTDSIGGNTLTATGTTVASGKYNLGRSFNGTSDYASRASVTTYNTSRTVEFWFKPAATGSQRGILSVGNSVADTGPMWLIVQTSGNLLSVYHGAAYRNGTTTLSAGTWYHGAYTFNSSNNSVVLYLNGKVEYSGTVADSNLANTNLYVGTGYGGYFSGSLDEIKIYNIVKSADEILEEYNATSTYYTNYSLTSTDLSSKTSAPFYVAADQPGSYISAILGETPYVNYQTDANTVGLWHLDEISGSSAYIKDSAGVYNGTPTGTTYTSNGKIGGARAFNGSSDYIQVGTSSSLLLNRDFTIDAWIKPTTASFTGSIISHGASDWYLRIVSGQINFLESQISSIVTGSTVLPANTWAHVAVTVNASGVINLYVNGALDGTATTTATFNDGSQIVTIGRETPSGSASEYFNGSIDEVRISNTTRTAEQIRQAYEVGLRTHNITIQFGANLSSSNLITNSSDLSFTVDATKQGSSTMGSNLYTGDKIIVKETVSGTEYIAQGTVATVNTLTGAVTVQSWDSSSTFPGSGFSANAYVFKWERQYMPLSGRTLSTQIDAISLLTLRVTDAFGGRNIWIDDLKSNGGYINTSGAAIDLGQNYNYVQYRALMLTADWNVSPYINQVQIDYIQPGPTMDQVMRHGKWFDNGGTRQTFWWTKK